MYPVGEAVNKGRSVVVCEPVRFVGITRARICLGRFWLIVALEIASLHVPICFDLLFSVVIDVAHDSKGSFGEA